MFFVLLLPVALLHPCAACCAVGCRVPCLCVGDRARISPHPHNNNLWTSPIQIGGLCTLLVLRDCSDVCISFAFHRSPDCSSLFLCALHSVQCLGCLPIQAALSALSALSSQAVACAYGACGRLGLLQSKDLCQHYTALLQCAEALPLCANCV